MPIEAPPNIGISTAPSTAFGTGVGLGNIPQIEVNRVGDAEDLFGSDPEGRYLEARGLLDQSLDRIGIDVASRQKVLSGFDTLRKGEAEAVGTFQEVVEEFQEGRVDDWIKELYQGLSKFYSQLPPDAVPLSLAGIAGLSAMSLYGLGFILRRHPQIIKRIPGLDPPIRGIKKHGNIIERVLAVTTVLSTLGTACTAAIQTATQPGGTVPGNPDGGSPTPPAIDPTAGVEPSPTPGVEATKTTGPKEEPTNVPPGYDVLTLLGNAAGPSAVIEAITREGIPNEEVVGSKYIKAHKFSEADLISIKNSKSEQNPDGISQYGINAQAAEEKLNDIELLKSLTSASVPGGRVYYFSNGLAGDAFRGFMLLVSEDGNSVWLAKNKDTETLNFYPNTFSGIDLSRNYPPERLVEFIRPWQPAETEPQETDRQITPKDISIIGGIDHLDVVFQTGTENAYLTLNNTSFKAGIDAVESVFDASTGNWLEPLDLSQDAILPSDWAANTAEGENKGKYSPEMFFPLVGGINHQNRKTVSLEANGLKIAVALSEQYFIDRGIDPLLGLTALSLEDQQALAEALSIDLDDIAELKAQLGAIRTQIETNADNLLPSEDITRYTVIIQNSQVAGIVFHTGSDVTRRYVLNVEGKLVQLTPEQEPQLLPELMVDGPYIKRADTGERVSFKGISLPINPDERKGRSILSYVKQNVEANERLGLYSNFVRLSAWTRDLPSSYISDLVSVADYLEGKGIYMIFTPHNDRRSENNDNNFLPNESDKQTVVDVATALKGNSNVIIGIWNEPAATSWEQWEDIIANIYGRLQTVYQEKSMPLLLIPGVEWSSDFRGSRIPLPKNLYLLDVHPYAVPFNEGYKQVDERWIFMIGNVPILITELSGIVPGNLSLVGIQSQEDLGNMKRILDIINNPKYREQIGYAIWRGDGYAEGVRDLNNRLTNRGKLLINDRSDYPQTDLTS